MGAYREQGVAGVASFRHEGALAAPPPFPKSRRPAGERDAMGREAMSFSPGA